MNGHGERERERKRKRRKEKRYLINRDRELASKQATERIMGTKG